MKTDKYKIGKENDRRIKLTELQKEKLKEKRKEGYSYNDLGKMFGCSKRLAMFVCNPDKLKELQERNKANKHHLKYYDTEKNRQYMRGHRKYKKSLLAKGIIK